MMRKWWHGLATAGALLAAALALTVAGLRPATLHSHGQPSSSAVDSRQPLLRFGPGGVFKVALFADLHYGEDAWTDWGPAQDAASDRVMAAVLDAENPGPCRCRCFVSLSSRVLLPFSHSTQIPLSSLQRRGILNQTSWCTSATW